MNLSFYGGTEMVSGSNFLLESAPLPGSRKTTKIMVDCGLFQGGSFVEKHNLDPLPYNPKEIEAVFVTHAHIDHTGRLPLLYKNGFRGEIFSTQATKDFAEQLLIDSEHLLNKDLEEKHLPPLYDLNDINGTMRLWKKISYHEKFKVKDFEIEFYDAGHILGSAFIAISNNGKTIVFSGDLGNMPAPLVKDTETITKADYVVVESTYGDRVHEEPAKRKDVLEDLIEDTVKSKGTLVIPAFAMERTQELLYELNDLVEHGRIPPLPVFIDSPLAIRLTSIYKKYSQDPNYFDKEALTLLRKGDAIFDFPRLKLTLTTEQSKEINNVPPPKVIVAGSGMSNGGRILHHELRYLPDPNSTILFIGYQAKGTLGRQIQDGAKNVRIFGEEVPVRCRAKSISGYSAHADQPLLLKWLSPMKNSLKKIFLIHGDEDQMIPFAQVIEDELAIEAVMPKKGEKFVL